MRNYLPTNITGYYEQIQFKLNDLILYYNLPSASKEFSVFGKCPHIDKLRCSKAKELSPDLCITERKCELYLNREKLFYDVGIDGVELKKLDGLLRRK